MGGGKRQAAADRLKRLGLRRLLFAGLNLVLLLAMGAALLGVRAMGGTLSTLSAGERFQGENELRFSQLACFMPVGQGKTAEDILKFRIALDASLTEQSLEAPENGSLYLDAYSGSTSVSAVGGNGSASLTATGVGGDFFYFHPLQLRSGSYISQEDLMDDLVVLDEEAAWRLFGGTELTGMSLTINGEPFLVAGVVSREADFATKRAYTGEGGLFMSYSAMVRLTGEEDTAAIDCYEIVMPNPIRNFAKGILEDNFSGGEVVENTGRFGLERLMELLRSFAGRSMRTNGVIYPYWENAARLTEDYAAIFLFVALLTGFVPACCAVVLTVRTVIRTYRFLKKRVPEKVDAAVEKRREERLEKVYAQKNAGEEQPWQS